MIARTSVLFERTMLAAVRSAAVLGIHAYDVTVEVDAAKGIPQWTIVGLPAGAVKESRERVGSALVNSGFALPPRRIRVNLAPADTKKEGTALDLPIAIGTLIATEQLSPITVQNRIFVGELGLDGSLRPVRGALPIARYAAQGRDPQTLVIPYPNIEEAGRVSKLKLAAPQSLRELVCQLRDDDLIITKPRGDQPTLLRDSTDFADVVGQESAKRALEVAAAGGHNVLLVGPPGAGKTLLARRLPTILPILTEEEALEVVSIHSVAGALTTEVTLGARPFRAPHHTISSAGLIGGGGNPRPGEVSLAHNGVLFLDEMLEFPRFVLDALRQPMEDASVVIARATHSVSFPARFTLIGATNPCPCGYANNSANACQCHPKDLAKYTSRLSGPLADRIDMHVTVDTVPLHTLSAPSTGESSESIRRRVDRARTMQQLRYAKIPNVSSNAHVPGRWLDANSPIDKAARTTLHLAADKLRLSARGYHRVLKVARTIADLSESAVVCAPHMAEALRYRPRATGR